MKRLLLSLLVLASGCAGGTRTPFKRDEAKPRPAVLTKADLAERILLSGELDAISSENLAVPRTPQWNIAIRWLEADGTVVKAGQKVAEFDNSAFASNLQEQKLSAIQAQNDLAYQIAQSAILTADKTFAVETARLNLEKAKLEAATGADTLPKRVHQQHQLELQRAQVALVKANDELESHLKAAALDTRVRQISIEKAQREIKAAEDAIGSVVLYAPRDGIVVIADHPWEGRKLEVGDNVSVGNTVARLPDLNGMKVTALLSDVDDGRVAVGMKTTTILDAYPELQFPGTVTEVSPVAREPSQRSWRRSFLVSVSLDKADPKRMLPGMSVRVEVEGKRAPAAFVAPRKSLDLVAKPPRLRLADGTSIELEPPVCNPQSCAIKPLAPDAVLREGLALGGDGS